MKKFNRFFLYTIVSAIIITHIMQIVFGFLITVNDFNIDELFGSSPLFDFSFSEDCQGKSEIIFHKWEGRKKNDYNVDYDFNVDIETKIVDQTDIKTIYGKYFCYKEISYIDLLYNGQIIKKGEECPSEYNKNCGRLDTLEQELCIKQNEKCPLYDIRLGLPLDTNNYISVDSKIYYNKDNYNEPNKTIVGRLILNDGQPCYNSTEKLWRKFSSKEGFETNLQCHMEIFKKDSDDRYENRGNISYKQLYKDNSNSDSQNIVLSYLKGDELVYLYKREFFGIDKQCDEKYNLNNGTYNIVHSTEESEKLLSMIGGFITVIFMIATIILINIFDDCGGNSIEIFSVFGYIIIYLVIIVIILPCFICHTVFYCRMISNDLNGYNCSDTTTNEIIRKEIVTTTKNILFIKLSLYSESVLIGACFFGLLIAAISEKMMSGLQLESKKSEEKREDEYEYDINKKYETIPFETPLICTPTPS